MRPGGSIRSPVQCVMDVSDRPFGVKEGPKRGSDITICHPTENVGQDRFQSQGSSELLFPVFWYPMLIPAHLFNRVPHLLLLFTLRTPLTRARAWVNFFTTVVVASFAGKGDISIHSLRVYASETAK